MSVDWKGVPMQVNVPGTESTQLIDSFNKKILSFAFSIPLRIFPALFEVMFFFFVSNALRRI